MSLPTAFAASVIQSNSTFTASCPSGQNLLSCGLDNFQKNTIDWFRSSKPISLYACQCSDTTGVTCVAWCTNLPVNNAEIATSSGKGVFNVSCPAGKRVLGCHIYPNMIGVDEWRYWYPSPDGSSCICYDSFGASCIATCAANINNYEVVSIWGTSFVTASCSKANNQVLGCGSNPTGASAVENFRTTRAQSGSCVCFDSYGTRCYAICGQLW